MRFPRSLLRSLGASPADLTIEHVTQLVDRREAEQEYLDLKAAHYPNKKNGDIAKDVAAMANTFGGIILLGVVEEEGRASSMPGVELSDSEDGRIRQVVDSRVSPWVEFDIKHIEIGEGTGVLALIIPCSVSQPHAVLEPSGQTTKMSFPVRRGRTTAYLREFELAESYRSRFQSARSHIDRLSEVFSDGEAGLTQFGWPSNGPWLTAALRPSHPGSMTLTHQTAHTISGEMRNNPRKFGVGLQLSPHWKPEIRYRRIVLADRFEHAIQPTDAYLELYADGSGYGALRVGTNEKPGSHLVDDELLTLSAYWLVDALTHHSANRCHCSGQATVQYSLRSRDPNGAPAPAGLTLRRDQFNKNLSPTHLVEHETILEIAIDEARSAIQELLLVVKQICTDTGQILGRGGWEHIDDQGRFRGRYFTRGVADRLKQMTPERGFEVTEDLLK